MHCPDCGALMNHHADKPVTKSDVPVVEVIVLIYCCPNCGKVEAEPSAKFAAKTFPGASRVFPVPVSKRESPGDASNHEGLREQLLWSLKYCLALRSSSESVGRFIHPDDAATTCNCFAQ